MNVIDGGYKLSELLFGRGGGNVTALEFRFWAVVLTKGIQVTKNFKCVLAVLNVRR